MSEDEYTLEDYIEYHRQPGSKMVAISDFNELVGSMIEENPEVEQVLYKLRQQFGPNEMLPKFAQLLSRMEEIEQICGKGKGIKKKCIKKIEKAQDQMRDRFGDNAKKDIKRYQSLINTINKKLGKKQKKRKNMKTGEKAAELASSAASAAAGGLKSAGKGALKGVKGAGNYLLRKKADYKIKKANKKAVKIVRKHRDKTEKEQTKLEKQLDIIEDNCKINPKNKVCSKPRPKLCGKSGYSEMSTSLEDELIEDEYEETCDKCGEVADLCDHEFEDQLEEVSIEDAQTLQHLVAFKSKCSNVRERLMKGKGRYIEQLKAYMNGDNSAEIRMFTGKKVKVSSLNPKKESLKSLFESFPNGPHIVECD